MKTQIWAHRGASAQLPENTMSAFSRAVEMGADAIELDVHLSADGHLIVAHDDEVDRVSNGKGLINDMTLAQLRELDFSRVMPEAGYQRVPLLAEVFELIKPTGLRINVEYKIGIRLYPGIEEKAVALAKQMNMLDRVIWSSFDHYTLQRTLACDAAAQVAPLFVATVYEPWVYARRIGAQGIHPMRSALRAPGLLQGCRQAGIEVRPWTVDDPQEMTLGLQMGVDCLITNVVDLALSLRRRIQGV